MTTVKRPRQLRDYQQEAVDAVIGHWGTEVRRTAVSLPTGTGKSTVIATLAAMSARFGQRVVMLAHRAELLDQMAATVHEVDPTLKPVGIVRAQQDECEAQIVAASLQTLTNPKRLARLGQRDVVLWDEVHHGGAATWREVLEGLGATHQPFFCGFSATLRREDGKALRDIIDTVAYERNLRWAIAEGHLVMPTGITVKIPDLDLGKVKTTAGDFQNGALAEVMEAENPEVAKAILLHCQGRRPIIFAASVDAAHDLAAMLCDAGMSAEAVTGAMSYDERQPIYNRYRSGDTQALVTVMVLTEGADFPMCDAAVIARPTQSQNLYSQMVGRALRLWPGKTDALVLDLVGTSRVLKLVTLANLDAGAKVRKVDTEGDDLPVEDDDEVYPDDGLGGVGRERNRRLGPIDTIGIDLLGPDETSVLWHVTRKGAPFIAPTGEDWFVFLWPAGNDTWKVGTMSTKGAKTGEWVDDRAWPMAAAKDIAEDYLTDKGVEAPKRNMAWRVRNQAPSEAQLRFAASLGIEGTDNMTKGRVGDEITIALASRRLDGAL